MQDQVFVPFKQLDQSSKRKQGGLGLGLSICQQLSILMSGDMHVISEAGRGSDFSLHLPLTLDDENADRIHSSNDRSLLSGAKVLLVDDNPVNLIVAEKLLLNNGLDVMSVSNAKQALNYFQHHRVDIVIMDWHMPEMDGVEATEKIRQLDNEKANIPIIGLTANAQHDCQRLYELADMNDVLTKPINPELLMDKLVHWLNVAS